MNFNESIKLLPDNHQVVLFPETGVTVTGADLRSVSAVCAAWLQAKGYGTIGIHMCNCPEFLYILTGALRSGVKVMLFNALNKVETDIPVFGREMVAEIIRNRPDVPAGFAEKDWGIDEPFLALYTSGTSGERKLIEKSTRSFFGGKGFRPSWRFILKLLSVRIYNCSPWYHNTGIYSLLIVLSGAPVTQVTSGKYNPETMRQNINSTLPGWIVTTPTMLSRSLRCGEIRLPSYIICTGEALSGETVELLERNGGGQLLYSGYGTTETGHIALMMYTFRSVRFTGKILLLLLRASGLGTIIFDRKRFKPNCVGVVSRNVEVKYSEKGEILVRSKQMAAGQGDAFFNTGDIGYLEDGLLFITGRSSSVINRSGEKIEPYDIEKVISGLPGVKSVAVFGIPSQTHGEDICAAIESDGGKPVVDRDLLSGLLPKYMIPSHLFFIDRFPMNGSGKADLSALKSFAVKSTAT